MLPTLSTSSINSDRAVCLLLQGIAAYADKIIATQVLNQPLVPVIKASQLILLDHFVDHCPGLFQKSCGWTLSSLMQF
ncbi:hypothetical protein PAXRUDRAFT_163432 [Paxillus rubicundulus Ve08.2h10]|uniref:Unplaced genomic scaffold scaffold_1703, whole genome shotgun sequence n=1 Tax=Paxillus rubicundulus Ve08.2h10 TaxID=930991 RepID=A0A0D0D4T5_9AGAM|nr:hypothetical protein PAXRUDRAFT_163432 [Paxillus rubicundulus Ve08.2h10]